MTMRHAAGVPTLSKAQLRFKPRPGVVQCAPIFFITTAKGGGRRRERGPCNVPRSPGMETGLICFSLWPPGPSPDRNFHSKENRRQRLAKRTTSGSERKGGVPRPHPAQASRCSFAREEPQSWWLHRRTGGSSTTCRVRFNRRKGAGPRSGGCRSPRTMCKEQSPALSEGGDHLGIIFVVQMSRTSVCIATAHLLLSQMQPGPTLAKRRPAISVSTKSQSRGCQTACLGGAGIMRSANEPITGSGGYVFLVGASMCWLEDTG